MPANAFQATPFLVGHDGADKAAYGQQFFTIADGAASGTNITVSAIDADGLTRGIRPADRVQAIINLTDATVITNSVSAIGTGTIQLNVVTTSKKLLVVWLAQRNL